ncbi:MAG TPA: LysE family translocator [Aestuariivirga sp.]|jgi:threonine/homoserine/homoserine lactone efflux protein|nr:LysE family translocator [Aestuariivirga sp.]
MTLDSYLAFCATAAALAAVPGPTVTVIIANSLRAGWRAGMGNVLGTQAGFLIWLAVAALGLGAAVKLMGVWFDLLRYAGAAYLVWLGVKMLRAHGDLGAAVDRARPGGSYFLQGFIVILSNPKMLVLFGAMIPPFLAADEPAVPQILMLGLTFMVIAGVGDSLYALGADKAGRFLSHSRIRTLEVVSGLFLVGGGLWLALRGK